jgi:hypothetical protein
MGPMRRFLRRAWPALLLIAFYWPALTGWFFQDDFGWLRLRQEVHSSADLPRALFAPKAHGNMRPLGENAYWLALSAAFGARALPFRVVTFATQIAALFLLGAVVRRLTKSHAAAAAAQVLWIASCGLAPSMGWSSIYNQVLSGFFFLLAFYCLLRHAESATPPFSRPPAPAPNPAFWWLAQWTAFVLGLGALETNVVYPVLAALYALLYVRPLFRKTLPLFAVAALSAAVHFYFAPAPHAGPYAPRVDARVFATLWTYWDWSLGRMPATLAALLAALALAFTVHRAARRDWAPVIALAWFVIPLAPYVVLPDHKMDYYLGVPSIGMAMLGASAVAAARRSRLPAKAAAATCLLCYLAFSGRMAWAVTEWEHDRGRRVEDFVDAVAQIRQANPGRAILLDGMDNDLFWAGLVNLSFHALRIPEVFLAAGPGSARAIDAPAGLLTKFTLPPELARKTLERSAAVVYRFEGGLLRNETVRYREMAQNTFADGVPRFINIGDAIYGEFLGAGWGAPADGYRPMHRRGSLRVGGPRTTPEALYIGVFRTAALTLQVTVDGTQVPLALSYRDDELSEFRAPLPVTSVGRPVLEVSLATDLDKLVFGYVEVR